MAAVHLVGAGPGDPELLTLRAWRLIREADVVVHDRLVSDEILDLIPEGVERIDVGKARGKVRRPQESIQRLLVELARRGRRVVRLKGGDPFIFGRGGEEAQALVQAGVPIRIVPGITAGVAGLAYAGIPATHRDVNQAVTFFTGHDHTGRAPGALQWEALAKSSPVLIGYMAIKTLPSIADSLIAAGRASDEPVAIIVDATLASQQVVETTLARAAADFAATGLEPPAIVCIGRVALMRQALDWIGQMAGAPPRDLDPLRTGPDRDAG